MWNSFLFPLVLLNSPDLFTVPLLLSSFRGQFGSINYGLVMAASALATIPMLIAFVIGQRRILNSMAASGLGWPMTRRRMPRALAALAGDHLDLVQAPFTLPRSRGSSCSERGEGVRVHTSEYERSLDDCRVLDAPGGARP